ncbi:MAG: hypothetical protein M1834_000711 [Cirrosporium novae-zelandiae]|nr:MAG: hypothetical protein M1834_000711 [Cirrosporium novae-zelandiae]
MIWYLTYPWTRSVNPPHLREDHPLRVGLSRYGVLVAQRPITFILLSLALGFATWYPLPFLYSQEASSRALSLPSHVWTSTRPLLPGEAALPDVEIRQAWIYGSYMRALEPKLLQDGLTIQNELLNMASKNLPVASVSEEYLFMATAAGEGQVQGGLMALEGPNPCFHSPFFYWNNSMSQVIVDKTPVETINERCSLISPFNMTLRPSSVFAGKRFQNEKLVAADALVISLFSKPGSDDGKTWDENSRRISNSDRWDMYHAQDDHSTKLYEFRFRSVSSKYDTLLVLAYLTILLRVLYSLQKLRGVRSRFGLVLAIMIQNCFSVLSTFAVAAIMNMNMSRIPMEAFAFVIAFVGFENSLRLVDGVLETYPESSVTSRIGDALGSFGLLIFSPIEKILILWLLNHIVAPVVAPICPFVAIALVFDVFYFLTFFIAILSADMQRLELNDFLERSVLRRSPCRESPKIQNPREPVKIKRSRSWKSFDRETLGNFRFALTPILILSIIILDSQSESKALPRIMSRLLNNINPVNAINTYDFWSFLTPLVRPSRNPVAWLYMQDRESAREIIRMSKPGATSLVATIYEPIVFVTRFANRETIISSRTRLPVSSTFDVFFSHSWLFFPSLAFVTIAIGTTLHFLLRDALRFDMQTPENSKPKISVKALSNRHGLDVFNMAAATTGILVSVGFDRQVCVWDLKEQSRQHSVERGKIEDTISEHISWPVTGLAVDESAKWLAVCSSRDMLSVWSLRDGQFKMSTTVGQPLDQFTTLIYVKDDLRRNTSVLLVRSNGLMSDVDIENSHVTQHRICPSPVSSCLGVFANGSEKNNFRILVLGRDGKLHVIVKHSDGWTSEPTFISRWPTKAAVATTISAVPGFSMIQLLLSPLSNTACLVNTQVHSVIHTFDLRAFQPRSVRVLHTRRQNCPICGSLAVASFSIAYCHRETGDLIMHTFSQEHENVDRTFLICLRAIKTPDERDCTSLQTATEDVNVVRNAPVWEKVGPHSVAGIRKLPAIQPASAKSGPRLRMKSAKVLKTGKGPVDDDWEAFTLSTKGELSHCPVPADDHGSDLIVSRVGPARKVGRRSIAVAMGNSIKLISSGNEQFDNVNENDEDELGGIPSRRKHRDLGSG